MSGIGGKGRKATAAPTSESQKISGCWCQCTESKSPGCRLGPLGKERAEKDELEACTVSEGDVHYLLFEV